MQNNLQQVKLENKRDPVLVFLYTTCTAGVQVVFDGRLSSVSLSDVGPWALKHSESHSRTLFLVYEMRSYAIFSVQNALVRYF